MTEHIPPVRRPVRWVRRGGLTTLLFALPMIAIFGIFSVFPIARSLVMAFQETNLAGAASWVGLDNFRWMLSDPDLPIAIRNTAWFALLALLFGYPIPLVAAVLMSEARRLRGFFTALVFLEPYLFTGGGPNKATLTILLMIYSYALGAWNDVQISRYFTNTVVIAVGSWFSQLLVATTGGYVISVLRPRYAKLLHAMVIATLFVPSVVLLVPLYLTVLNPPLIGHSLLNTYWAAWLPAGASAFNVLLVTRFFDSLPREVFEAARVDGAGPFRLFTAIVLPMSKPILGVVSVFAFVAAWKDFLWPMLVLKQPQIQLLSVRLPAVQAQTDLGAFLAALAISTVVPVAMFLVFQRLFLRGAGLGGAVKG